MIKTLLLQKLCLFFFCSLSIFRLSAAPHFTFSDPVREAYHYAMSLQFEQAKLLLAQARVQEPENCLIPFVENYVDFFIIFLDEEEKTFQRLEKNKTPRLEEIEKGDKNSPYYLYTQAEIKLHWALARLKFKEYVTAVFEIKSAYKLLTKNQEKFPDFVANQKSLGILHALIGTVPDSYRWGLKLLGGMEGTIAEGQSEIESALRYAETHDFIFEEETVVMYAFLLLHLGNKQEAAWETINRAGLDTKGNPLACFALANVAMHTGRNDEAIRLLQMSPRGGDYYHFPYLDYMLGLAKLYRQDADADKYLHRYLEKFRGKNYIKEAYQKIAWHHLLFGKEQDYQYYIRQCLTKGDDHVGGDKQALKEAKSGEIPHPRLLRARLLFDGGYKQQAYQLLLELEKTDLSLSRYQLEYTYRLGRITHELGKTEEALKYYQQTIDDGRKASYYYACNAALQMGLIQESKGEKASAIACFNNCLSISPDEYKNSLHQKAKAGLNRLK